MIVDRSEVTTEAVEAWSGMVDFFRCHSAMFGDQNPPLLAAAVDAVNSLADPEVEWVHQATAKLDEAEAALAELEALLDKVDTDPL